MHELLTVIVVLLIIGILLDGWRRMRAAKRDNIRVSRRVKNYNSSADSDSSDYVYPSELPNGGARVVSKGPEQAQNAPHTPQQNSLNLDESVPMLMEEWVEQNAHESNPQIHSQAAADAHSAQADDGRIEPSFAEREPEPENSPAEPESANTQPDEVIIINVMAPEGQSFVGDALLDALLQAGMRFGDMNIFHRHSETNGDGPVLFSLANMVKPGTFDLDNMNSFETPGISIFMTLPLRTDSLKAFDIMRTTAESLAVNLGGELKDEQRSVMTRQTMDHCRQRIQEYERKRLSRVGA